MTVTDLQTLRRPDECAHGPDMFRDAMRLELAHIWASGHFSRARKLAQLLQYLAAVALEGSGRRLTSVVIAVDGLGKPADFDAQIDSDPRVQALRLRRKLAHFYAQYTPANELCIFLEPRSYRLLLAVHTSAYPEKSLPGQAGT